MLTRSLLMLAGVVAGVFFAGVPVAIPAQAGELRPEEAKRFVAGKLFAYTCFEGTKGLGRIFADGSVHGTIQIRGSGPVRLMSLPAGTVRVQPDSICASVRGMPFTPCFAVNQLDSRSFRGSVSGLGFAYCDFSQHNPRAQIITRASSPPRSMPMATLRPAIEE
jgi:hypothetical protein